MRIFNRVIAAAALTVPMALGVSGIAAADVAADSSVLPTQIGASEDDGSNGCDHGDCHRDKCQGGGSDEGGILEILFGGDNSGDDCEKDEDAEDKDGDDEEDSGGLLG